MCARARTHACAHTPIKLDEFLLRGSSDGQSEGGAQVAQLYQGTKIGEKCMWDRETSHSKVLYAASKVLDSVVMCEHVPGIGGAPS